MSEHIIENFDECLKKQGWKMVYYQKEGVNTYLIRIAPDESPPPLGIHVVDGLKGKDKPGG